MNDVEKRLDTLAAAERGILREKQLHAACEKLWQMTRGRCDAWELMGPSNRLRRKDVMSSLLGRKATIAESGVTAIERKFTEVLGIDRSCSAQIRERIRESCAAILAR